MDVGSYQASTVFIATHWTTRPPEGRVNEIMVTKQPKVGSCVHNHRLPPGTHCTAGTQLCVFTTATNQYQAMLQGWSLTTHKRNITRIFFSLANNIQSCTKLVCRAGQLDPLHPPLPFHSKNTTSLAWTWLVPPPPPAPISSPSHRASCTPLCQLISEINFVAVY